jgi:hypothetical protein
MTMNIGPHCFHLQGEVCGGGSGPRCKSRGRKGRDTCELTGRWVKPEHGNATGGERKEV